MGSQGHRKGGVASNPLALPIRAGQEIVDLYRRVRDPFVLVNMRGRIIGSNAAYRSMVGYSAAELSTLTYAALTPSRWHAFEATIVRRQIRTRGHSCVYEKEYRRKDGTVFPVELRTFLVRDARGRPAGMWAIVRDISARKRMESELRMAQFALEQLSLAAFWVDEDARVVYVNKAACRSLGYSRAELLSMTVFEIDPSFSRRRWRRHWRNGLRGRSRVIETVHRTRDGRVFPVEVAISVFRADGRRYHCDFVRDITARKEAEAAQTAVRRMLDEKVRERTSELQNTVQELRKAAAYRRRIERTLRLQRQQLRALVAKLAVAESQERRRIATGIHDDISQMLAAAKLKTGQIGEIVPSDSEAARWLEDLESILGRVIETSRSLTFDLASPVLYRIGLQAALEDLCDRMGRSSPVAFVFRRAGTAVPVVLPIQEMVFQFVKELARNVVQHARARRARVHLTYQARALQVAVSDDGIGFREDAIRGVRPSGGFGLHAIRERIRFLGGRFSIRPLQPHGSVVTLVIPLASGRSGQP